MRSVELNPEGNFDPWQQNLLDELKNENFSDSLGQQLLFENESIKVWSIVLLPGERLPFRHVDCNFSCVSRTDGMAITRSGNGRIGLHHIEKSNAIFLPLEYTKSVYDLQNISNEKLILHITEFKPTVTEAIKTFGTSSNK